MLISSTPAATGRRGDRGAGESPRRFREAERHTLSLLTEHRDALDRLVEDLVAHETVDGDAVNAALHGSGGATAPAERGTAAHAAVPGALDADESPTGGSRGRLRPGACGPACYEPVTPTMGWLSWMRRWSRGSASPKLKMPPSLATSQ